MHHRPPLEEKLSFPPHAFAGVNSGGNPRIYGRERKVQLIMFTYISGDIWGYLGISGE
jgi:hypothetical protein